MTFRHHNLGAGTFMRREGQLQQISVFAFLLNLKKTLQTGIRVKAFIAKNACRKYVQIIIDKKRN